MKITEYKIAIEFSTTALQGAVTALITEGWQPLGGVASVTTTDPKEPSRLTFALMQAVVRYAENRQG